MDRVISWKRLCFFLVGLVVLQFTFLFLNKQKSVASGPSHIFDFKQQPDTWWTSQQSSLKLHNETVDTLTAEQCQQRFPNLFFEVNRAVAFWKARNQTISQHDVDISWRNDAAFRILIHDNELRILQTKETWRNKGYRMRTLSVLSILQSAIVSATAGGEVLPTIEAAVVVDDMSLIPNGDDTHSIWTFATHMPNHDHERHWLIPDFAFYSASTTGSFRETRRRAFQEDALFIDKIPQAVWRGVLWTNQGIRDPLLEVAQNKSWSNVKVINWETRENIMSMDEMCKYAFTIHTEGRSYSGRLQFLLNCDSLPIIHDLEWNTHFYHLLVRDGANQNYVPVKRDFSDLESIVKWYLDHPVEAQIIITNSNNMFRSKYTSPAATSCYLRRLIQGWSTVAFTPEVHRPMAEDGGVAYRRGISFEEFVHLDTDYHGEG